MPQTPIVLASTSKYRQTLLSKLHLPFEAAKPNCDETPLVDESPQDLVCRLAEGKATSLANVYPEALIIGSDQVACFEGTILGKPGNRSNAIAQLMACSGRTVTFHTGLCLHNAAKNTSRTIREDFHVHFRALSQQQIERYVDQEQPFDCAGSFKSEGYGICLFERLEGRDPNSLIGLPLIALLELFAHEGVCLP